MRSVLYVRRRQFYRRNFEILAQRIGLQNLGNPVFPYGTLAVNSGGCFAIGFLQDWQKLGRILLRMIVFVSYWEDSRPSRPWRWNVVAHKRHPRPSRADQHWAATVFWDGGRLGRRFTRAHGRLTRRPARYRQSRRMNKVGK